MPERLKKESVVKGKNGGARLGAGRKQGSKNKKTIEDDIAREELRDRVIRSLHPLLDAQMNLAQGCQVLFKITVNEDKDGKKYKSKPEIVTNEVEIAEYLAEDFEQTDDEYYFITTQRPDNRAVDSLFDRALGKAKENVDVTIYKPKPITDVSQDNSDKENNGTEPEDSSSTGRDISEQDNINSDLSDGDGTE